MKNHYYSVEGGEAMVEFGRALGKLMLENIVVYLVGDLATGKTTFSRGILSGIGHHGAVKSPTYSYVETYNVSDRVVYHFDLYRVEHPEELEQIGVRDYFCEDASMLIEWPEKGANCIPKPELVIHMKPNETTEGSRLLSFTPVGTVGYRICEQLKAHGVASVFFVGGD